MGHGWGIGDFYYIVDCLCVILCFGHFGGCVVFLVLWGIGCFFVRFCGCWVGGFPFLVLSYYLVVLGIFESGGCMLFVNLKTTFQKVVHVFANGNGFLLRIALTEKIVGKKVEDLYHGAEVYFGAELLDDGTDFANDIGFFGCGEGAVGTGGDKFVDVDKLLVVLVQQDGG